MSDLAFGPHRSKPLNKRATRLLAQFESMGVKQKHIAAACEVSPSHLSHVKEGDHEASKGLVDRLEQFLQTYTLTILREAFKLKAPDARVVATCKSPSAERDSRSDGRIISAALKGLVMSRKVHLPAGTHGALVQVGSVFLVVIDYATGSSAPGVIAHELEALARELRGDTDRGATPDALPF